MKTDKNKSRRDFIKKSSLAAAGYRKNINQSENNNIPADQPVHTVDLTDPSESPV